MKYKPLIKLDPSAATPAPGVEGLLHPLITRESKRIARCRVNLPPRAYEAMVAACISYNAPQFFPADLYTHDLNMINQHDLDNDQFLWSLGPCGTHLFPLDGVPEGVRALRGHYDSTNMHFWWDGSNLKELSLDEALAEYHVVMREQRSIG
jgi:hypothetical protein